jgi:cell division protein FtsZ
MRVTVIATGLTPATRRQQVPISVVHTTPVVRSGTDGLPVLNQTVGAPAAVATPAAPATDYAGLAVPSVWRHGRTAAAKVDALVSNGMDEIEIPAFLRKQAD